LIANLRKRFRDYAIQLALYKRAQAKWLEEQKERAAIEAARKQISALEVPHTEVTKPTDSIQIYGRSMEILLEIVVA
jgi:hypothetical protein